MIPQRNRDPMKILPGTIMGLLPWESYSCPTGWLLAARCRNS